jgi:hypothetical protein
MFPLSSYGGRSVVVTGADGFIGSHLSEAPIEEGLARTAEWRSGKLERYWVGVQLL